MKNEASKGQNVVKREHYDKPIKRVHYDKLCTMWMILTGQVLLQDTTVFTVHSMG
jgi:hypothetical protein